MSSFRILRHLLTLTDRQGVTIGPAYSMTASALGVPRIDVVTAWLRATNERWRSGNWQKRRANARQHHMDART